MSDTMRTTEGSSATSTSTDARRHRVSSAKLPVASVTLTVLGLLWGLALVALGVVGIHDALTVAGLFGPPQWIVVVLDAVGDLRPVAELVAVATVVGLVGLILAYVALRPRRQRGVAVGAQAGTFLRYRHLNRLVASRVESLDGVVSARAKSSRRKVQVSVQALSGIDRTELRSRVGSLVREELTALERQPSVDVRVDERSS